MGKFEDFVTVKFVPGFVINFIEKESPEERANQLYDLYNTTIDNQLTDKQGDRIGVALYPWLERFSKQLLKRLYEDNRNIVTSPHN